MNTTTPSASNTVLTPVLDIYEKDQAVYILAELPGVNNDNLNLQVQNKTLTIQGVISLPTANGEQQGHEEVKSPYYSRTLMLGDDLDADKIDASFNDGLLTLKMALRHQPKSRKIDVKFS